MDTPILWPRYFLKAALDYLFDRRARPAITVDNSILNDGILATREKVSGNDFVIVITPEYVANLDFDEYGISFTAKFDGIYHQLFIPYEAIIMIHSYQSKSVVNDNGEMNVFPMPKVIYPPGAARRNEAAAERERLNQAVSVELEEQPSNKVDEIGTVSAQILRVSR